MSANPYLEENPTNLEIAATVDDIISSVERQEMAEAAALSDDTSEISSTSNLMLPSPFLSDSDDMSSSCSLDSDIEEYLKKQCEKPCWVVLKRLSEEEVQKYPVIRDNSESSEEEEREFNRRYSRNLQRISKFEEYKKNRQNFLKKKRRQSSETEKYDSSNDEYRPPDSYSKERKKKRKKLTYEDDVEWSPNLDQSVALTWKHTTRHKKSDKLRITPRRRRIETDSDSDSDFDYETYMYDYDEDQDKVDSSESTKPAENLEEIKKIYDPSLPEKVEPVKPKKKKPKTIDVKSADSAQNTMIDSDVLSRIMQEMEDYNMKNRKGSKVVRSIFNGGTITQNSDPNVMKASKPKMKRCGIKKTSGILPPSVCTVQKLLSSMVNTVVTIENDRLQEAENIKMKKCRWCEIKFTCENSKDVLCVICRDTVKAASVKQPSPKKKANLKKNTSLVGKVNSTKSKIMNKVLKNLPKSEQQRLIYSDKADKSNVDKGYNHLKAFSPKRNNNDENSVKLNSSKGSINNTGKKVKQKKKTDDKKKTENKSSTNAVNTKVKKKKKNAESNPSQSKTQTPINVIPKNLLKNIQQSQKHVSVTNVNKGLFLMTFPDPDKELEISPDNPTLKLPSNSVSSVSSANNCRTSTSSSVSKLSQETSVKTVPSNKQYGSYVMPSVPTVVVANYSASESKNGDYVLSGVFYQNEITQNSSNNKVNTSVPNKPLSMPTVNQLTMKKPQLQTLPTNSLQNVSLPPNVNIRPPLNNNNIRIPFNVPTVARNIQPPISMPNNNIIVRSVVPQPRAVSQPIRAPVYVPSSIMTGIRQPLPNNIAYPTESEITRLINRCGIQITPSVENTVPGSNQIGFSSYATPNDTNYSTQPDFSRLLNTCGLQITPTQTESHINRVTDNLTLTNNMNYALEPELINNAELHINSILSEVSQLGTEPFENQDLNLQNVPMNSVISSNFTETISVTGIESENNLQIDESYIPNVDVPENNELTVATGLKAAEQTEKSEGKQANLNTNESNSFLKKHIYELEALSVLGIVDLDKNPKSSLLNLIEQTNKLVEELSKDKSKHAEYQNALKTKEIYQVAKKWFVRFGSFTRLSEHFLKVEEPPLKTPLEIKKELIEEEEEEMPSCQFANNSSNVSEETPRNELSDAARIKLEGLNSCEVATNSVLDPNHIEKLQTQIDAISDELESAGVDCTVPIPGIAAMSSNNSPLLPNIPRNDLFQDSRETPSRGSGPITPTRPESAASHTEERLITPAQVKKERMESASSPFSQCAYSGVNVPQPSIPPSVSQTVLPPNASPSIRTASPLVSMSQILPQAVGPSSTTYRNSPILNRVSSSPILARVSSNPNMQIVPSVSYSNAVSSSPQNVSIRSMPQNSNFSGSQYVASGSVPAIAMNNNYNNIQIQSSVNFHNQVPPNRTAPFNTTNQNFTKVLMNLVSKPPSQSINAVANPGNQTVSVAFNNAQQSGQLYMQQQQQQLQQQQQPPPLQQQQQPVNQIYNVQQVYLPNRTPILQQTLNSANAAPAQTNNQYVVRQTPDAVSNNVGGTVLLNNASIPGNSMQQGNMYSLQNPVATNYPQETMNTAIQQIASTNNQISPEAAAAFLMQRNQKLPSNATEMPVTDMFCAMCNKIATLRCKQCTKVAYCNAICAKTYWHQKHKMECIPKG